ncbi:uncharacterized protein L3040_006034 [Drepanopeziza brunnea f. sp. 'multigermtubi']|uniref:Uncharacterized protein n=1 Tax=Marssonina brunnea f. sp. multigermtubi (strain MB_m1) TaxID=1072389 RepID=K1WVF3_MARBU|nr:uncharacterized protein MBM_04921 [Drepanopeziza brunnea f. sp. 'multigermtubi' MB_m1]EKD16452.1 hypothetical protein MBM_04921 [Drepanopeziza brunnea f. sp. 'multigermtubi' MB_m1]KAJ5040378.1 hypothetical protein L3040_006034 [Drepanopeziza brunnea f. sp. 'multigermtubi']
MGFTKFLQFLCCPFAPSPVFEEEDKESRPSSPNDWAPIPEYPPFLRSKEAETRAAEAWHRKLASVDCLRDPLLQEATLRTHYKEFFAKPTRRRRVESNFWAYAQRQAKIDGYN